MLQISAKQRERERKRRKLNSVKVLYRPNGDCGRKRTKLIMKDDGR